MSFTWERTIHFRDTDAAGVIYFSNVLSICHEAYEASLSITGIELRTFFNNSEFAVPIVHANVDFFRPLFCGDQTIVKLIPRRSSSTKFEVSYEIFVPDSEKAVSRALTRHVCIHPLHRKQRDLPQELGDWLHEWGELDGNQAISTKEETQR